MQNETTNQGEKRDRPPSIVLEVQSLRHVMQAQLKPAETTEQEEQDHGEKH